MIRDDLIIGKTRTLLDEFLAPMQAQLDKPRRRFLKQAVRGIVLSGTLVVMELCRWIKDNCPDRFYQDKRLLHHLVSPRGDLNQAVTAYRQRLARVRHRARHAADYRPDGFGQTAGPEDEVPRLGPRW